MKYFIPIVLLVSVIPIVSANHIESEEECIWISKISNSSLDQLFLHGTSATNIWASSRDGTAITSGDIIHYDGTSWSLFQTVPNDLFHIYATSINDVWTSPVNGNIAGQGPYHYTGTTFTQTTSDTLTTPNWRGVYSINPTDAWAVTSSGHGTGLKRIHHWDGVSWVTDLTVPDSETLNAIHGSGPTNIWAVGGTASTPSILHYDGISWTNQVTGIGADTTGRNFDAIHVVSATQVYALAGGTTEQDTHIWKWDGLTWNEIDSNVAGFQRIHGIGTDLFWLTAVTGLGVVHYDGITNFELQPVPGATSLTAIFAANEDNVWAAGAAGQLFTESCHVCITAGTQTSLTTIATASTLFGIVIIVFLFIMVIKHFRG